MDTKQAFNSLNYDGCGINWHDAYRTRLATFSATARENGLDKEFGPLFAAAPELLAALKEMVWEAKAQGWDIPVNGTRRTKVINAVEAIAKAEGKI